MIKSRLPDFLIVGAAKSGTTSLYHYLKAHPSIYMPDIKEPCFFSSYSVPYETFKKNIYPANEKNRVRELDRYKKIFATSEQYKSCGEASTHYLFQFEVSINNIKKIYNEQYKQLKIIIILRNPIKAAYSNFRMWAMHGYEKD
ncbi:MAG: sulfotransferase domain-containing protein, partial [Halanaerobium sp.]